MRTLRLVTSNAKLIRVNGTRGYDYDLKVSDENTSIVMATNNDYYHYICESRFTSRDKCIDEFYDDGRKGLFNISSWFSKCWMSAYRYINLRSLHNLEDD